jgi:hypothetical protein
LREWLGFGEGRELLIKQGFVAMRSKGGRERMERRAAEPSVASRSIVTSL